MTSAQDFLVAKFALRANLVASGALQECLEEQRRRGAAPTPLVQLLVQRRLIARDQLVGLMRTVEATTFDCERCRSHFTYSALATNAALACPRCRGPLKILKDDGEPVSERLMTGRKPVAVGAPMLETRKDPSSSVAKTNGGHTSALVRTARDDSVGGGTPRTFGPYEIISELGRGGMGVVYKARHPTLDRIVALKVLIAGNMASKTQVKRFQREAELAGKLKHPGIVPIHDIGQVDDRHYFTMEFVEGQPLENLVKNRELSVRQAVEITRDIARALAHAHANGVVHRDVKPANIIVDTEGRPHVMDFGLAKDLDSESPRLTREGAAVGTPFYMAPEQAKGDREAVGPHSDIYSLGVVCFELLTFDLPFKATTQAELTKKILNDPVPRPSTVEPAIEPDVELVVLKALEKDPALRYGSADEMADDLDRWLAGEPVSARPRGILNRSRALWRQWRATLVPALVGLAIAGAVALGVCLVVSRVRAADAARRDAEQKRLERERKLEEERKKKRLEEEAAAARARAAESLSQAEQAFADADRVPIAEGQLYLERLNQAIGFAGDSIAANASSARAFLLRGRAREQGRQFDVAIEDYRRARELDATGVTGGEAGFREARLAIRRSSDEVAARQLLTDVTARTDAGVWRPIARACLAILDKPPHLDDARNALEEARQIDRLCPELMFVRALVAAEDDRPVQTKVSDALASLDACLEIDHKHARAYAVRAKLHLLVGRRDLVDEDVATSLALDPDESLALLVRANMYSALGRTPEAIADLKHVVKMQEPHEDPELLIQLAQLLAATGVQGEARSLATRAIARDPKNEQAYLLLARLLASLDLYDQALEQLRAGLKECRSKTALTELRDATISVLFHARRLDDAEKFARDQVQRSPDDPGVHLMVAEVVAQRGPDDMKRAEELLEEIHKKFPAFVPAWRSHAHFLLLQKREKDTLDLIARLTAAAPTSSSAWVVVSTLYELLGRRADARTAADSAVEMGPKNPRAHTRRGVIALQENDVKKAESCAHAALELDPNDAEGLTLLGAAAYEQHRPPKEVVGYFSRALDSDPTEVDAAYMLSLVLISDGKYELALKVADRTLSVCSDPPPKLITMFGIAHLKLGHAQEAEHALKAALKRDPSFPNAHAGMAELLLGRNDAAGARAEAQLALDVEPDNPVAKKILELLKGSDAPGPPKSP